MTKQTKKYLIIAAIIIIIAVIAYFVFFKKNNTEENIEDEKPKDKAKFVKKIFPLQKGSKGNEVENLQKILKFVLKTEPDIDSDFGGQTENALNKLAGIKTVSEKQYMLFILPNIDKNGNVKTFNKSLIEKNFPLLADFI